MFTLKNPCTSEEDLRLFTTWWEYATRRKISDSSDRLEELREKVRNSENEVSTARAWPFMSRPERARIGRVQEDLVHLRGELLELESAHPHAQPHLILSLPGIEGFVCSDNKLNVHTSVLYGRDHRSTTAPWCRIGRFEIRIVVQKGTIQEIFWSNRNGIRSMGEGKPMVPAPQVDVRGLANCLGDIAKGYISRGFESGRVDMAIAAILRYTEQPLFSLPHGSGMGTFPPVPIEEVPAFYRLTEFRN